MWSALLRYYFLTTLKLLALQTEALVLTLLCCNPFIPATAKPTSGVFHMRTPKTTPLMGLFLFEQGGQEEGALTLAVFSGINGWVTESREGFNRLRINGINKVRETGRDLSNYIHM